MTPLCTHGSWQVPKNEYVPATERPKERWRSVDQLNELVRRAIAAGCAKQVDPVWRPGEDGTTFRRHFEIRYDGNCQNPTVFAMMANHKADATVGRLVRVELFTRCRKCETCMGARSMYWAARAVEEFHANPSTYMVTLTLRPEMHYHFDAVMHQRAPELLPRLREIEKAGRSGLASATLFRARAQNMGTEIQRYLKRLRKRAPLRYLQVAEAHREGESLVAGRPHFHLLVHEVELGTLVRPGEYRVENGHCPRCDRWHKSAFELCDHAFVRTQWPHGYTKVVRCVDEKTAYYLCKYMSKAMEVRVRASLDYGDWRPGLAVQARAGSETIELDKLNENLDPSGLLRDPIANAGERPEVSKPEVD